ncbi:MAG TPA: beta-propeller domain-containing protein [Nitrosopumilaceae archaeon]|nr:beta-propeller domain-containing protein [Nitrosopumilaceae archaeon]
MNNKIAMIVVAAIAVAGTAGLFYGLSPINSNKNTDTFLFNDTSDIIPSSLQTSDELKKFSSPDEIKKFLIEAEARNTILHGGAIFLDRATAFEESGREGAPVPADSKATGAVSLDEAASYSTTNVQVSNVDEPDFLKNDGKYAYVLSGDKLTIIEAYPAESANVVLKIGLDVQGQSLQNMFLNKDRLVIFYQGSGEQYSIQQYDFMPRPIYTPTTHALIMDVSDKENPKIVKDYEVNGNYYSARMIGDRAYFIVNNGVDYRYPIMPLLKESSRTIITPDVYYFDNPEQYYNFNTITSFDIFGDEINSQTFMMGYTNTMYVSEDNIYLTYQKNFPYAYYETHGKDRFFQIIVPLLPEDVQSQIRSIENSNLDFDDKWNKIADLLQETYNKMPENDRNALFDKIQKAIDEYEVKIQQDTRKTVIHKIAIDDGNLNYVSKGEVPGYLLNQFSMDESGNRFRIATTSEFYTQQGTHLYNNVYVLDDNLNIVGSLEKVAQDESIYSTRFIGDRLYMVTFERIDPFFVIDLSENTPRILGALKIPGYSNYLHPYDENHIIGIGKETKENKYGGIETLGVKVALFDVSDVQNPKEVDVYTVGGQGTDSEILWDHKALLFSKEKNILSIPIWEQMPYDEPVPLDGVSRPYIEPKAWRGFYVFGIDVNDGFSLKGKVEHISDNNYYWYGYGSRSFYIGDVLYTVSPNLMKMNDLNDINREINQIKLENTGKIIPYLE